MWQLILGKIIKSVANRCQILSLIKYRKIDWRSANPVAGIKGTYF